MSVVVTTVARFILPFMQLYGFYVLTGTEGPGGGFQGGVILASSFILYAITFGEGVDGKWIKAIKSLGLWIYAGVGVLAVFYTMFNAEFLNYSATFLSLFVPHTIARGIIIADVIEVGIGMAVCTSFVSMFFDVIARGDGE